MQTPGYTKAHWGIVLLTAAYLLAAAVGAVVTGNGEFVFYLVVMVVLCAAVAGIDRRVGFSIGVLAALSAWGAMHMAGGLLPVPENWPINGDQRVVYSWWVLPVVWGEDGKVVWGIKYDHVTHAYGFGVTCWACWEGLRAAMRGKASDATDAGRATRPTFGLVVLCVVGALGFGALNEVVEFAATMLGPTNVGGYENTGWDLVANTIGAVVAGAAVWVWGRR
jgi:hypothetical protein